MNERQQELDEIAELRKWAEENDLYGTPQRSPGRTEPRALATVALQGGFFGWLGIVLAGGLFGTFFFPCFGTWVGGIIAGAMGVGPAILSALLYVAARGRISLPTAMCCAGGVTGTLSLASLDGVSSPLMLASYTPTVIGLLMIPATLGALCGRGVASFGIKRLRLSEGRGAREWRHFSIVDLMLVTTWVAVVASTLRLAAPHWIVAPAALSILFLVSLGAAALVEGFVALFRWRRRHQAKRHELAQRSST